MSQPSDTVTFFVNGEELTVAKGSNIIEATDAAGISVPRFCYHDKLPVAANCRMCLVEIENAPKPVPACATPVGEGMKVYTKSPLAIAAQQSVMEFLLINHPLDCPICDEGGECELQDTALGFGNSLSRYSEDKRVVKNKDIGPLIATEMTRCIHCTRCVRFGEEIGGVMEMGATGRGEHSSIETFVESSIDSELSGNMIDLCPVGALTSKPFRFSARSWELDRAPSIASHDCVGSNVEFHSVNNIVKRCVPRENSVINEIWISDRDRFSYVGLNSDDRLKKPLIKQNGEWTEVDWQTALDVTVKGLKRVVNEHSAANLGAFASPSSTTEEFYLLQKLMRGLGSPHIESRLRRIDFSSQQTESVQAGTVNVFQQLSQCDASLLIGSNLRKDQPLMNHWLRKAVVGRNSQVSVINQVDYEFNFDCFETIISHPLEFSSQISGVCKALLDNGGDVLPRHLTSVLSAITPSESQVLIANSLLEAECPIIVLGNAALSHPEFSNIRAISQIIASLCDGKIFETFEANSVGGYLAGAVPHRMPGGAAPEKKGLSTNDMVAKGLKSYVLMGVEPDKDFADCLSVLSSLENAEFVVSLSAYDTKALRDCSDVILPIVPFTETPGTFVNIESTWQSFNSVVLPLAEARPGWKVLRVLGNLFEFPGFEFSSSIEVLQELKSRFNSDEDGTDVINSIEPIQFGAELGLYRVFDFPNYGADAIVRRSLPLQQTSDVLETAVFLNSVTASGLNLSVGNLVTVTQGDASVTLSLQIDDRLPVNAVLIPAGQSESPVLLGPCYGEVVLEAVS